MSPRNDFNADPNQQSVDPLADYCASVRTFLEGLDSNGEDYDWIKTCLEAVSRAVSALNGITLGEGDDTFFINQQSALMLAIQQQGLPREVTAGTVFEQKPGFVLPRKRIG